MFQYCWHAFSSKFSDKPDKNQQMIVYILVVLAFFAYTVAVVFESVLAPECTLAQPTGASPFSNPKYNRDPCLDQRHVRLLGLSRRECDFGQRLLVSVLLGVIIGFERRSPDRPAGVRTMSLTSLGAACFTVSSMFAFEGGTMEWDASRVAAAIPSGVGFLGAGLIWKGFVGEGGEKVHEVHGLTTAASVWLSAAVGVACGGGLYFPAAFTVGCMVLMLRFGPRNQDSTGDGDGTDEQLWQPAGAPPGTPLGAEEAPSREEIWRGMSQASASSAPAQDLQWAAVEGSGARRSEDGTSSGGPGLHDLSATLLDRHPSLPHPRARNISRTSSGKPKPTVRYAE